jgi:histone-lysine N-methyltransferase SUV39H
MMDLDFNDLGHAKYAVDARFKGNLARFINHSCNPNLCINPSWSSNLDRDQPTIAFFSCRNIAKGEELFIDYNAALDDCDIHDVDEEEKNQSFVCKCGASNCRGIIF